MEHLTDRLKVLADPTRARILEYLRTADPGCCTRGDGVCACDVESHLELSQPTISHHMGLLVEAGFVRAERRGRWVYYELEPEPFREVADALVAFERSAREPERTPA